jgi:enoyl-CoA hydratase
MLRMDDPVLVDVRERVALVTLNRPEARNALSGALMRSLAATMIDLDGRDDVDAIVLTGTDPAFSAGLDLKELGSPGTTLLGKQQAEVGRATVQRPFPVMSKPVIGAINGVAVTGGLEIALNCDFLVASERAKFGDTHSRVGVQPGWGLTVLLPQAIGVRRAREMSFTGNFVPAELALHWGLVNHVVPHEELVPFAVKLATDIAGNDRAGVRRLRQTYADIHTDESGLQVEADVSATWRKAAFDPAIVAERRESISARGRAQ